MVTYRISNNYQGMEGQAKLSEFARLLPGQASGILLALFELGAAETEVRETAVINHIGKSENYRRLWPNSDEAKNTQVSVSNTVAQYRPSFKALPFIKITVGKGRGAGTQGPRKPDVLTDPVTGETFPNPFIRNRKKKGDQTGASS